MVEISKRMSMGAKKGGINRKTEDKIIMKLR